MRRVRRFLVTVALGLSAFTSTNVFAADAPAKLVAAQTDDEADKEIERLYADGKYDEAFSRAEKLVAERETKYGKEDARTASAISDLGAMHIAKGNVANAEPLLKRAIEILEKNKGPDATLSAALSNLTSVHLKKGDFKKAEATLDRAIALEQKAGPARESEMASLLTKMATIFMQSRRLADAEMLLLKAIAIHEKAKAERALFLDWSDLGTLYRYRGRYGKAAEAYNRALPLAERLYGEKHPDVGRLYHVIGIFLNGDQQFDKSDEYFGRAEKILIDSLGPSHPAVGKLYGDWAFMLPRMAKMDRALALMEKAQAIEEKWLESSLAAATDDDKLAYAAQLENSVERAVSFQMGPGLFRSDTARFALKTILRNKARALDATAAGTRVLRDRMTPENQKRFDEHTRIRAELASRYTRGPRQGQTVTAFQEEIDQLTRQAAAVEAELSKESAAYRKATKEVTIESIAERIPRDAALVEVVTYKHRSLHFYNAESERDSKRRYMVYVLRPDGAVFHEQMYGSLGGLDIVKEKVNLIRRSLQNADNQHLSRELNLLHGAIFIRLLPHLTGVKHLLISPDGDLSLVPFSALIDNDGRYMAEKFTITYLSSGRDLLRFGENDRPSSAPTVLANPDYDAPGEDGAITIPDGPRGSLPVLARAKFSSLPGTAEEAEAIRQIIPEPTVKVERIATESALKQLSGPKILHVATHGFFLDDSGKAARGNRGLELEVPVKALPTAKSAPPEEGQPIEVLNPMFLSGIALAGANVRKGQLDDGILTAYEASALDLQGTELVVLSACETGVGSGVAREGVQGLRRALVLAGAETQVMSLWQVDDEATRDLMTMYYQNLFKGRGRSEAMRDAQLALLAQPKRKHPYYWASFIVSGNWAPLSGVTPQKSESTPGKTIAVQPGGAKGCGCRIVDTEKNAPAWLGFGGALLVLARRRRRTN